MVFVKNFEFFHFLILRNIRKENVFYDILEKKEPFSTIKTRSSKSRKIDIFERFFLGNIGQENVFYQILERKNAFQGYKNN